jgi:hypothetical protein
MVEEHSQHGRRNSMLCTKRMLINRRKVMHQEKVKMELEDDYEVGVK